MATPYKRPRVSTDTSRDGYCKMWWWDWPSYEDKKELERLQKERDAKKEANDREIALLKAAHQKHVDIMESEMTDRNSNLKKLRDEQIKNANKHEEELRQTRKEQDDRMAELKQKQEQELAKQKSATEAEKRRLTEKYDKQAVELKKEHDAAMRKAEEQKEQERQRRDEQIAAAEQERKELMAQQREAQKNYKTELDEKYKQHRKEVNEQWDKLAEQMERHTRDALLRIAETTDKSMAIVNENYVRLRKDAIESLHNNLFKEYIALEYRIRRMNDAGMMMVGKIEDNAVEVPYDMQTLNSDFNTELNLLEMQTREMKNRMRTSFDVSEEFKSLLMSPLQSLETSCMNTKPLSFKVLVASQKKDPKMLISVREKLDEHLGISNNVLIAMGSSDFKSEIGRALEGVNQRQITRD